jgi:hypothetical protein
VKARDIDVAWARACDGLGLSRGASLSSDEASVLLKYLVAEGAADAGTPPRGCATHRARAVLRQVIDGGLDALGEAMPAAIRQPVLTALREDHLYAGRILDLAVSDLVSEPMAPEVCISIEAWDELSPDGTCWTHGIVFHAAPLITHEIYPLAADALVHDARQAGPYFRVLGVHGDWIEDGCARRVLFFDADHDRFLEASLTHPVRLDSAHLLALSERQIERHRCWASSLDCRLLNPWPAAAAADDKEGLRRRWQAVGLEVPEGILLAPGDRAAAHAFLDTAAEIVVKPNEGTEGDRVLYLRRDVADATERLDVQLTSCWEWGAVLVERRRDGVGWRDPDTGRIHSLALRLHVAHDGERYIAESGYAQVGVDPDHPASRGAGGTMLPIATVLTSLVCRIDGGSVEFGDDDLDLLRHMAEKAASTHDTTMGLAGIDIVLDTDGAGAATPVLLELNPRPAGLAHSRFLPGAGEGRGEAGVSLRMWDGIHRLQPRAALAHPETRGV